jgi:PAS domain S-box-containing protein
MKALFSWSIRTHLLLLVMLAILPSLGIILYSGIESRSHAVEQAEASALRTGLILASHQERTLGSTRQLLMTLAKLPIVQDRVPSACNPLLRSLLAQNPCYASLLIADPSGKVFASAPSSRGVSIADRPYFQNALATRDFSVGGYAVSRTAKKPVLHFAYPSLDSAGRVRAVIVAAFDLAYYGHLFSQTRLPEGSALAITDSRGIRLFRYPDSQKYLGVPDLDEMVRHMSGISEEGTFLAPGVDGIVRLYAFRRLNLDRKGPALFIRVGIPARTVVAAAKAALTRNLALMGCAAVLALLCAWLLGEIFIVRRLTRLVGASRRLGKGELNARTGLPHGEGEMGHLATTFDEMAAALERRESERTQAESALMESEKRLKLVLQGSNDGFWDWNMNTREVRHSDRWSAMLGYQPDELECIVGTWKSMVHPEDMQYVMNMFRNHIEGRKSRYEIEYRMRHKSGAWVWILDRGKVVEWNPDGTPLRMSGTATDITERKKVEEEKSRLEAQLLQAQKMEAVGQLAGGIAHDFNNILTAIVGYGNLLLMKVDDCDLYRQYGEQILAAADRGAGLTRSLLTFSRKQIMTPEPVRLNEILSRVEKLLTRLIGEDIELLSELSARDPIIMADGCQVEQVLMNLATNARDAMPSGGRLSIRSDLLELDMNSIESHGLEKPGRYALISVTDTGTGMDAATRGKIFEPFFTTKEVGKGTGLGLAMAYGIIQQHAGLIAVSSEPGSGTTFSIYLPIHEGAVQTNEASPEPQAVIGGTETILLAEDDDMTRKLAKILLERRGYRVITAVDGEDAIQKFLDHRESVGMLILDLVLPIRNGKEVYTVASEMKPGIKVLFTSGYTADNLTESGLREGSCEFIAKPFPPDMLLRRVREILDSRHALISVEEGITAG